MIIFFGNRELHICSDKELKLPSNGYDAIHKYSNQNELKQFVDLFIKKEELAMGCIYYHDIQIVLSHLKQCFLFIEAAGGLIKNSFGEFLIINRLGYTDLPKGKAEKGETPELNALREVAEETGLTGHRITHHICDTWHTYPLKGVTALKRTSWFMMHVDGRPALKPQTEENIAIAKWCSIEEVVELTKNTYPSLKPVFSQI
ncbi:MAG: NUDIX domain-containing protein [Marinilabiliaceae bacterium]|nr:NUDIX domain-containing protein [Marinilabiliaceae bacterium]